MKGYKVKLSIDRVDPPPKTGGDRFRWFIECHQPFFCVVGQDYKTRKGARRAGGRIRKGLGLVVMKDRQRILIECDNEGKTP